MATKRALRAVDEATPRKQALSVTEAAAHGSHRELLVAVRARVAKAIQNEDTPPRDLASLSLRLLDVAKQIEALDAAEGVDDVGAAAGTPDEEWAAP
jgi:hypothetical protein